MSLLSLRSREIFHSKLKEKQEKKKSFSLRALARRLKISPTALSEALNGRRKLSEDVIKQMSSILGLNLMEQAEVLAQKPCEFEFLDEETFESISDWEFFAVLNMAKLEDFKGDPAWIAQRLGIEQSRAEFVFTKLVTHGFLFQQDGNWQRINKILHCKTGISTTLAKKCLRQDFDLILESLDNYPVTMRDSSGITFILTEDAFKEAMVLIRKVRVELASLCEKQGDNKLCGEVYKLSTHLIPLTRKPS